MIRCESISKSYGRQEIIKDFSYSFNDNGFYLLFGESGCGKTTFLNIIAGLTAFDGGRIEVEDMVFEKQINQAYMMDKADYITQDTFFVDFLTVTDNLRLIKEDGERIKELLRDMGLDDKSAQYPAKLSGGERQRLALARILLRDRPVVLLDEPTAALDEENKVRVFEILRDMSKDRLVICSSHDAAAIEYASEVVEFEKKSILFSE